MRQLIADILLTLFLVVLILTLTWPILRRTLQVERQVTTTLTAPMTPGARE